MQNCIASIKPKAINKSLFKIRQVSNKVSCRQNCTRLKAKSRFCNAK